MCGMRFNSGYSCERAGLRLDSDIWEVCEYLYVILNLILRGVDEPTGLSMRSFF